MEITRISSLQLPSHVQKCDFFIKHSWKDVPTLTVPTHEVNEVITNNPILHW